MFRCMLGRYVASTVLQVPDLSEGAESVDGHLRGDKKRPFSGVTNSGRVWKKVPETMVGVCIHRRLYRIFVKQSSRSSRASCRSYRDALSDARGADFKS